MTDSQKAKFILNVLAKMKLEFDGAKEAFCFTDSYKWLVELSKELDKKDKNVSNQ